MTEAETPKLRERLAANPADVLKALPSMGKVMILSSLPGVTHERIGAVESVTGEGGYSIQAGEAHDSRVRLDAIAGMIVDRNGGMNGKVFPRIDFQQADGTTFFSVVGFEGLEPFDKALARFGSGAPEEPKRDEPFGERPEATLDDPAAKAFQDAVDSAAEVTVLFKRDGFEQRWRGKVEAIKPSMGFINVMRPDFHLHIKAGSVDRWRNDGGRLVAEDAAGGELGLSIQPA